MKNLAIQLIYLIVRTVIIYLIFYFFTVELNPLLWMFWTKFWFILLWLLSYTTIDSD